MRTDEAERLRLERDAAHDRMLVAAREVMKAVDRFMADHNAFAGWQEKKEQALAATAAFEAANTAYFEAIWKNSLDVKTEDPSRQRPKA